MSKLKVGYIGVGLMGHDDQTVNETADLATLPSQTKRMAVLLHRIHANPASVIRNR